MKRVVYIFGLFILFLFCGCKEETRIMSVTQNDNELSEDSNIPILLEQNYPNPFAGLTVIQCGFADNMKMKLTIYTEDWMRIKCIAESEVRAGMYQFYFNGRNNAGEPLPAGDYYYMLEAGDFKLVRKMKIIW